MSEPFERSSDIKLEAPTKSKRASEMVRKFMERSEKYRRPHIELARKARELYECWSAQSKSPIMRANLKLPYFYTVVETELPQLFEAFMKERPFIKYEGKRPQATTFENQLTDATDSQLDEMNFSPKFASFLKNLVVDGTAIAKVPYVYKEATQTQKVLKTDSVTGQQFLDSQDQLKVIYDGPDFINIPIYDFFPDWRVKEPGNVQAMRGCVHRMFKTLNEIKSNKKQKASDGSTIGTYENISELEMSVQIKGNDAWKPPYYEEDNAKENFEHLDDNERNIKDKDTVEVWEYYGLFDKNNDGKYEEYIITVANGDVTLRCEPTFYNSKLKPFVAGVNVIRANEFYGISEGLAIKGLIKEATQIRNSILDQVNLSINRMWVVDRNAGIKTKSLFSRPGGIIHANDINGIKMLEAPEIPVSAARQDTEIQSDIQNATGLSNTPPAVSQLSRAFGRSATGVQFIQSFAASRVGLKIRLVSDLVLKPFAHLMFNINKQFMTDPQWIRISDPNEVQENGGNPFTILSPDAFYHDYDFTIETIADTGGAEAELQKYQTLAQLLQTAEGTQPGIVNWQPLMTDMGRLLVGRKIRNFIRSPQEMMQLQAAQVANQNAANAAAGMRAPQPASQNRPVAIAGGRQ